MWSQKPKDFGGSTVFFRLSLSGETLHNYYSTNFSLMHHHKYSLTEVENLLPWEKEIYISLLMRWIEEENKRQQQQQQQQG